MSERIPYTASVETVKRATSRVSFLVFAPLFERFRLGEGALLAINAAVIWFLAPEPFRGAVQLVLSFVVIAALYSFNDLVDCQADRHNPKKNQKLVSAFVDHEREFTAFLYGLQMLLVVLAWVLLDLRTALVVIAIFAINMLYSLRIKGVPFADIVLVGVWGGIYCAIPDTPWRFCLLVGIMTTVSHVFQILVDRDVDTQNDVHTTAVRSLRTTTAVLAGICVALYVALLQPLGALWGLTAFAPLALHLAIARTETAWMLSRIYFGAVLLVTLGATNGIR